MTRPATIPHGGPVTRTASLLCCLLALCASAVQAQDRGVEPRQDADDTQTVLRAAENMARDTAVTPPVVHVPMPQQGSRTRQSLPGPRLYVFVSFSMPAASLQRLAAGAAAVNMPLVLRGMAGDSLAVTARRAAEVVQAAPGASFEIDPAPFARFGIERVPAFVIAEPSATCASACTPGQTGQTSEVLTGDVTLDYALERLARGDAGPAAFARNLLARLGRRP